MNHLVFDSVEWQFLMVSPLCVIRRHVCSRGAVCLLSKGKKILVSSVTSVTEMLVNDSLKETSFRLHHLLIARDLCLQVSLLLVLMPSAFKWIGQWLMACWFWTNKKTNTQTNKQAFKQTGKQQANKIGKHASKQTLNNMTISLRTSVIGTELSLLTMSPVYFPSWFVWHSIWLWATSAPSCKLLLLCWRATKLLLADK